MGESMTDRWTDLFGVHGLELGGKQSPGSIAWQELRRHLAYLHEPVQFSAAECVSVCAMDSGAIKAGGTLEGTCALESGGQG